RLHVPRRRRGRVRERDVPPDDPRVLQGAALHDRRPRDPRARGRAGHPQHARLGKLMPFTKWCFLAGALALVGIPPFSGFFSKDSIVASAAALGTWYGWIFWVCGIAGAFLTGLYTFRLWFLVFPGEPSPFVREHYHDHHGREGAWTMLVPVGILAVLATVGGWLQWSPKWHPFTDWLAPAAQTLAAAEPTSTQEYYTSAATVIAGLVGIGI